jgi:hypothetical protein
MGVLKVDPLFNQLVERLSPTVAFSGEQTKALRDAIASLTWSHHVVDIRVSAFGFYCVLLGGFERRSQKRLAVEAVAHPLFTPANLIVLILLSMLLGFALNGVFCQLDKLSLSA